MKRFSYVLLVVFLVVFFCPGNVLAADSQITIKEIKGLVQVQKAGEADWGKAQEFSTVTSGDKIRSFLESSALLAFPDGSEFYLRENTSLDIKDISQSSFGQSAKRELKLNLGSLHYKVPPKKEKATEFKVYSSTSIVGITGTEGIITSRGGKKPSENILIEGSTYNTNDQGLDGRYQTKGNVYTHDGKKAEVFSAQVDEEAAARLQISEEHMALVKEAVALYKKKKDEGCKVIEAGAMLDHAFFYLENRQYDMAEQMIQKSNVLLEKAKKIVLPEDLDGKIKNMIAQIKTKEDEGYDVAKAYSLAGKIQDLKQLGHFNEIRQAMTQVEKELAVLGEEGGSAKTGKTFVTYCEDVQKDILEKEQQGFVLNEIKSTLRQSQVLYAGGDAPKAYRMLDQTRGKLSLALKTVSDALRAKIDGLQNDISLKKTEGYPTKELELKLEKIKVSVKEQNFLKVRELVASLEEGVLTLTKSLSAEWKLKISNLKRDVTYKRSIGYDLGEISDFIGQLEQYQAQGDLINLEATFLKAEKAFEGLKLPVGFDTNWKEFTKKKKAQEALGYNLKEINDLNEKIEGTVEKGDIKSARSFLNQAEKLLAEMKDQEPPKVQVLSFNEEDDLVTIEGYASDNTKVKSVSVNNSVVKLADDGKFLFSTAPTSSVKKLSVLARDIQGNISAPVVLEVTSAAMASDVEGKISGTNAEYLNDAVIIKGEFAPGGTVNVGGTEAVCDSKGNFAVMIHPDPKEAMDTITVTGIQSGGALTEETVVAIEDKWAPEINIKEVTFNNSFVPTLKVDPLDYKENRLVVSGQVSIMQMAEVKGSVSDLGGGIESLIVDGRDIEIREDGGFSASLTIDPARKDLTVKLVGKDKAGNTAETKMALDAVWDLPSVKINTAKTFLSSSGQFSREVIITEDVNDVAVVLEDSKGQVLISKRMPVAAVLPPELEIQDIRYEGKKVLISGRTTADATVSDKNKTLFTEDIEVTKNTVFTLSADYPDTVQEVVFVATNIEGKISEEVRMAIGLPNDTKAPVLYISSPQENNNMITIKGFVDDDSGVTALTVQGEPVRIAPQSKSFSHDIAASQDLKSVEVTATDEFGNTVKKIIALKDKEPPQITINTWKANEGRLIISGKVNDNIGVKEVRLNDRPIVQGSAAELAFSYNGTLTEASKSAVIVAVDLLNNETREGPRALEIPTDTSAPKGKSIGMKYGSPIVYASGEVNDPAGVKAVYVNGEEVELFDDGTFNIKVNIEVGAPKVELESPSYDDGKVVIAGKVVLGDFTPAKITVESEDLSGNRGVLFSQEVAPYKLNELEVVVNGEVVEINETGGFSHEQPILLGERSVEVSVQDPFDNSAFETLDLEDDKPALDLEPLDYDAGSKLARLSGKATDEGVGLYTVDVNGIRVDLNDDGSFSYTAGFDQETLSVVATDYIGNVASLTKEVNPPDVWAPVFSLNITPTPAIIGDPVYVEIAALDSNTGLPEILGGAPTVTADAEGTSVPLTVDGDGANYIATLDTTGLSLDAALVTVKVSGKDEAGNSSTDVEGTDAFVLVTNDAIVPSFTVEAVPSPVQLGVKSVIKVYASEDLAQPPMLEAILPSGGKSPLTLSSVNAGEYKASLTVSVGEGIGTVQLKLSGGEDLSGNVHDVTETAIEVVAPVTAADLPLNINKIEFLANRLTVSGQTAPEAIVHIEAGRFFRDIVAGPQGMFRFERPVSVGELEEMHAKGPNIGVMLKAHNYAGFESQQRSLEVPLPPLPELGGTHFEIRLNPMPAGQGDILNISVEPRSNMPRPPRAFLYMPDGTRAFIELRGQGVFNAQYPIPEDAALGMAMFEVVTERARESVDLEIVLSDEWMQRLNKYEFFKIRVSQDPLIVGEQAQFFVETMGDLPMAPRLEIMLPDGRMDLIPLSGSMRFFQGSYFCPADVMPGRAELVLNSGMPEEVRRPYGVEDPFSEGDHVDVYLFANPNPLIGGEPYDVNVSFSHDVPFRPRLVLTFQDGRTVEMPLEGSVPSSRFMARGNLPDDVGTGLAKFTLFDDRGMMIDAFPAQVTAPMTTSAGVDIFVVPDMLHHLDMATIQLNFATPVYEEVEAHISYSDGTKMVLPFYGSGGAVMTTSFSVPVHVPFGMVSISVMTKTGTVLGSVSAQVIEYGDMGGPINIFLSNPEFAPYEMVKLNVDANWPLPFVPRAELFWDGGSQKIFLNGQVPGNRFTGEFIAPSDPVDGGKIEIRDDRDMVIGDFLLDHRSEGEGEIIVTPMPPVIGQPLSIKVTAPSIVDSAPMFRLIFDDGGQMELNAYGPIPGDTFTASLALLERPLRMIEIVHEGQIIESIPVEYLSMANFTFFVDIPCEVAPCMMTDVIVRADNYVPFTPYLSVDFEGRIVDVPLSKMSPMEFFGRMNVPCDAYFNSFNMQLFDPQGKLLWQKAFSHDDDITDGLLYLNAMPVDDTSVMLTWDMLSGIEEYEIRYGDTAALGQTMYVRGVSTYTVSGLRTGEVYFFEVAARKNYSDIMVSDIMQVIVGGTTRELNVQDNVINNDVYLTWSEYAGADMYRVLWGNAPAVYPNSEDMMTTDYYISDLIMGSYNYIKVQALQDGQVIGESRELYVHIEEFVSSGGEIYFNPDPPMVGQYLMINMHFYEDLPFIPEVIVRMQSRDVSIMSTGQYRDYSTYLTGDAFDSPIIVVDVLDPNGGIIASRMSTGETYTEMMVPIDVIPDPPGIGVSLQVRMDFTEPPPFTPRLVVEFASGIRDYDFGQAPYMYAYDLYIPVSDMNSSILYMKAVNPNNGMMIGERAFSGGDSDGYDDVPFTVVPNPPIFGQSVNINLETDMAVSLAPKLRIYFDSGMQEVNMGGTLPGRYFTYDIGYLNSNISKIDIVDPVTLMVKHTWNPDVDVSPYVQAVNITPNSPGLGDAVNINLETGMSVSLAPKLRIYFDSGMQEVNMGGTLPGRYFAYDIGYLNSLISKIDIVDPVTLVVKHTWTPGDFGPTSCDVVLQYYPPVVGQLLQVRAEFPGPVGFVPRVSVELDSGIKTYTFPGSAGASIYEIFIPAADIDSHVNQIEIWDDSGAALLCEEIFGAAVPVYVTALTVTPELPSSTQSFQIHVEFNTAPLFTPQWRLDTSTESFSGSFSQGAGYMVYDESVAAGTFSGTPGELEIQDDMGMYISGGEIFFDTPGDFTCTATFTPNPPEYNTSLVVTATYPAGGEPSYKPWFFMDFDGGGTWQQEFSQVANMQNYSMTIPYSQVTDHVIQAGIGEYPGDTIDCGENFSVQAINAVLTLTPSTPDLAVNLDVTVTFSSNAPFIPELVIEYSDSTMDHYVFTGPVGQLTYQITIPKEDFNALIERIVVEDDQGLEMGDIVFSGPPPFDITNLSTTASDEINVCWTYYDWIDEYKIYFRTASGSYMDGDSPVTVGSSSCYTLGISETLETNSTYYLKVEAFDAGTYMFATSEDNITLTATSVEYPTNLWLETTAVSGELKVRWDSVSNVDGYYVYYGLGSQNYNGSGSPLDITDSSETQAVISSLNDSTQYYITVEAYIGTVESNNPDEVFGYPGTGSGGGAITVAPADLAITGNPGAAIAQQGVTVTNNGMVAVNIRVEPGPLGSISSSHYTIYPLSANIAIGGSNTFTIDLDVPPEVTDGSYPGIIKFYADDGNSSYDTGEAFADLNIALTVGSVVNDIEVTAEETTSTMGDPIFVTLKAKDSNGNIVLSYDTAVAITVSESSAGQIPNSWILSTNGAPGGPSTSSVEMFGGIGNFTVDAQEPETLTVDVSGASSVALQYEFTPSGIASVDNDLVIIGPNRVPAGPDGAPFWIAVVDIEGRVDKDSGRTIIYGVDSGASVIPASPYTLNSSTDNGQFQVIASHPIGAMGVTLSATSGGFSANQNIDFVGVTQYLVYEGGSDAISFTTKGTTIRLILRAADGSDNIVRSYNKDATFSTADIDAYINDGTTNVSFEDGVAEITLNNSTTPETVTFSVDEVDDNNIDTETITANFQSNDGSAPEIVRVEMDTPWIVHIYFNEDVTSVSAREKGHYDAGETIDTVCWYTDNVTLHLAGIPASLGGSFSLDVVGVEDSVGNATSIIAYNVNVPNIDYQGAAGSPDDWFEVQVSDTSPSVGDTVHVTVYHKNVCGYLSGSNADNAKTPDISSVSIAYTNESFLSSKEDSVSMGDGRADFDITVGNTSGTVTISASGAGVSTTQVATLNIQP